MEQLVHLVEWIIGILMAFVHWGIDGFGYAGVALMMAIESCNIPLPSELIMPYAGFLVQQGKMNMHWAAFAGAVGCVLGSLPSYWLGQWGGEPFVNKYGKFLLVSPKEMAAAKGWVQQYGNITFFICRMLPIVRTFISLPAGALNARFWPFIIYTFIGSWGWCYGLTYVGIIFGDNLAEFKHLWHKFDAAIAVVILVLGTWYVWKHVKPFLKKDKATHLV